MGVGSEAVVKAFLDHIRFDGGTQNTKFFASEESFYAS